MFVYNESENSSLAWTYLKGCVQITVVEFSKDSRYQAVQNSLTLNSWTEKKRDGLMSCVSLVAQSITTLIPVWPELLTTKAFLLGPVLPQNG